jgi:hypothetical protein
MPSPLRQLQKLGLGLALISWSSAGQISPAKQSLLAMSNLRLLSRSSGYIFDGTVLAVERVAQNESDILTTVKITFRVEQAIRGTRFGQVLTIREWAGLWNSGEHYRPGERLLLFLYSPSKLGLTSSVGGPIGRFDVDSDGNALLENGHLPGLALDPTSQTESGKKKWINARALALAIQHADTE